MRKVYIITCTTEASKLHEFTLGRVEFVFTSKVKANKQLDIIMDKIENGGWWSDSECKPLLGRILKDSKYDKCVLGVVRDVLIETPNGLKEVFRLSVQELNSGFGF